jgi:hypothetical protein
MYGNENVEHRMAARRMDRRIRKRAVRGDSRRFRG